MGMQVGETEGVRAEINVVPLIDILLVLLIIFMVITPLTPRGLEALLPQPSQENPEPQAPPPTVIVQVSAQGLKINQDDVTWEMLGPRLTEIFKARAERVAFLRGDDELMFAEVARAVDVMRTAGVDAVGLLTPQTTRGF